MKLTKSLPLLAILALGVAACSDNKTSASVGADLNGGLDAEQVASLSELAQEGEKTAIGAGVDRFKNDLTVDGKTGTVTADIVAGAGATLITTAFEGEETEYALTAKADAKMATPSGDFEGPIDMSYRTSDMGATSTASGGVLISVDGEFGEIFVGGAAFDDTTTFELSGDGVAENGTIQSDFMSIRMRDGQGEIIGDHDADLNGVFVKGTNGTAISGLVKVDNETLKLNGAYTAAKTN